MNMVLGILIIYVGNGIHAAHTVGTYETVEDCYSKVHEVAQAIPDESLPDGGSVYSLCLDTTKARDKADAAHSKKPPSTSI